MQICCEDLRTPPSYTQVEDSSGILLTGVSGRVYETSILSTAVGLAWGRMGDVTLTYPPGSASPPSIFTSYTVQRFLQTSSWMLSIAESVDVFPRATVRPYVGGGLAFSHVSWDQRNTSVSYADPDLKEIETQSYVFHRWGLILSGGVRFYPTHHFVIGGEAGGMFLREGHGTFLLPGQTLPGDNRGYWRVEAGVAF